MTDHGLKKDETPQLKADLREALELLRRWHEKSKCGMGPCGQPDCLSDATGELLAKHQPPSCER